MANVNYTVVQIDANTFEIRFDEYIGGQQIVLKFETQGNLTLEQVQELISCQYEGGTPGFPEPPTSTPEPSYFWLLAIAGVALVAFSKFKRNVLGV